MAVLIYKIYKIINLINGKIYVGQTIRSLEERFKEHCRANSAIGNAIRKYGKENFKIELIEECETLEESNELEKYWIKELNCKAPNGYNLTDGGEGKQSRQNSEESRLLMSIAVNKYYEDPLAHEKKSAELRKRYEDPLEREKTSAALKKYFADPLAHEKNSLAQKKRYEDPLEREKTSVRNKKYWNNPDNRKKQSERQKARWAKIREQKNNSKD